MPIISQKRRFTIFIYIALHLLVILTMVFQFLNQNYNDVFLCLLTLVLFQIPSFIDRRFKIYIPDTLLIIILLFIFAAEILGEIKSFYIQYPGWDTVLHTINGFLMAAIGFALIDIFNRSEKISTKLSPSALAFFAFCFSMTIGVLWEFFEFGMDYFFNLDMQKDTFIYEIKSVALNPEAKNIPVIVPIESVVINGEQWEGYLDIGLIDTMKDLIVNFIGAFLFSFFGYVHIKNRDKHKFVKKFIPIVRMSKSEDTHSKT